MADLMRFGMAERVLLALWVMLARVHHRRANTAVPDPNPGLVTVVQWWARIGVVTGLLVIGMPAFRLLYREYVAPHLPNLTTT